VAARKAAGGIANANANQMQKKKASFKSTYVNVEETMKKTLRNRFNNYKTIKQTNVFLK